MGDLDKLFAELKKYEEDIISDMILYNQLPISKDSSDVQKEFILNKLNNYGVPRIDRDEAGNIFVNYNKVENISNKTVLLLTPISYNKSKKMDRFIRLGEKKIYGKGVIQSSLKVSVLLNLINMLYSTDVKFKYNLKFLFTDISHIEENFKSINHFLDESDQNIVFGIDIDSTSLGDIGHQSLGKYLYKIKVKTEQINILDICNFPNKLAAMDILTEIAARLKGIGWPKKSCTFINIIDITSESKEEVVSNEGIMILELLSRKSQYLEYEHQILKSTIEKLSKELGANIKLDITGYSPANYLMEKHPFIEKIENIHKKLSIDTNFRVIRDEAAVLLQRNIPTVSLGITEGQIKVDKEYVDKNLIIKGIQQILMVLKEGMEFFNDEGKEEGEQDV